MKRVQFVAAAKRKPRKKLALPKAKAKAFPTVGTLKTIERIKMELPDRVRRRSESNLTRADLAEAHTRASYAAELDRLHGEAGLHGAVQSHRISALAGRLNVPLLNGLPTGVSAQYQSYTPIL